MTEERGTSGTSSIHCSMPTARLQRLTPLSATTRPETMLGDEAVAVNPKDTRYAKLVGRKLLLPLPQQSDSRSSPTNTWIRVRHRCAQGDARARPGGLRNGQRHNFPLTVVIGPDGTMTAEAGEAFAGLDRFAAREAAVQQLTEQKFLVKTEDYKNNVGYSERSRRADRAAAERAVVPEVSEVKTLNAMLSTSGDMKFFPSAGPRSTPLDDEHPGLVHLPPALVGASGSGVDDQGVIREIYVMESCDRRDLAKRLLCSHGFGRWRTILFERFVAVPTPG